MWSRTAATRGRGARLAELTPAAAEARTAAVRSASSRAPATISGGSADGCAQLGALDGTFKGPSSTGWAASAETASWNQAGASEEFSVGSAASAASSSRMAAIVGLAGSGPKASGEAAVRSRTTAVRVSRWAVVALNPLAATSRGWAASQATASGLARRCPDKATIVAASAGPAAVALRTRIIAVAWTLSVYS